MMKEVTVEATGNFELKYDPQSPEFQQALSDYREIVDRTGTEDDMILNCVHQLRLGGAERMLEGIGWVKYRGKEMGTPYSGIEVVGDDDPSFEYEIQ